MEGIKDIEIKIQSPREALLVHPIYTSIADVDGLRRFAETHVFAVWDFMSLLKSLQRDLTCTTLPWLPVGNAETRFLINEIVVGEESDVDQNGRRVSHFELYREAMGQMGASTAKVDALIESVSSGSDIFRAIEALEVDVRVKEFLSYSFDVAFNEPTHIKAAVFTFGREDLIPEMFLRILDEIRPGFEGSIETFRYYIERHIEVDGGHHKDLAHRMVQELCGSDAEKWESAAIAARMSIEKRIRLWDSVVEGISRARSAHS